MEEILINKRGRHYDFYYMDGIGFLIIPCVVVCIVMLLGGAISKEISEVLLLALGFSLSAVIVWFFWKASKHRDVGS